MEQPDRDSPMLWIKLENKAQSSSPQSAGKEISLAKLVVRQLTSSVWCQLRSYENRPKETTNNTVSPIPKWGHKWIVEDSSKGQMHWKTRSLGWNSSRCEHLGVGREESIDGSASAHLFHKDGSLKVATHYPSPLCKSSFISLSLPSPVSLNHIDSDPNLDREKWSLGTQPEYVKKTSCVSPSNSFPVLSAWGSSSLALGLGGQDTTKLSSFLSSARKQFCQQIGQFCLITIIFTARSKATNSKKTHKKPNPKNPQTTILPSFNRIAITVVKLLTCPNWIWCIDVFSAVKIHVLENFHISFDCTEICHKIEWKHDFKSIKFKFSVFQNICDPNCNRLPTIDFPHYL